MRRGWKIEGYSDFGLKIGATLFRESFLLHLVGAKDAFLQEVNFYYGTGLKETDVNEKNLKLAFTSGRFKLKNVL